MRKKPYTNFKLVNETLHTAQESSQTNHDALEAIRKEQMRGRVERFPAVRSTVIMMTTSNFNEWANHIHNLLTKKS